MLVIKKGDTWLLKPSIANFSCRTLYGSYPMSVMFSCCLIGSYLKRQFFICFLFLAKLYPSNSSSVPVSSKRHSSVPRRFSFSLFVNRLIRASRLIASDFVSCTSRYTSSSGPRPRVYFAPFPLRCCSRRAAISFVHPV